MPYKDPFAKKDWYEKHGTEYHRKWRSENREKCRDASNKQTKKKQAFVASCKDKPCMDCDRKFPPECMDFDHVRGKKLFNVSMVQGHSLKAIAAEILKCDVVCACCHRIRTVQNSRKKAA